MGLSNTKLISLLLFLIPIFSCDEAVNLNTVKSNPRLVVNSLITPEQYWKLQLSETSNPFDSDTIRIIDNASVRILTESREEFNLKTTEPGIFSLPDSYPTIGKTYTLKIDSTEYPPVEATTTIPPFPGINIYDAGVVDSLGPDTTRRIYFDINFTLVDPSPDDSFFLIKLDLLFNYHSRINTVWFSTDTKAVLNSVVNNYYVNYDGEFYNNQLLFSDQFFDSVSQNIHLYSDLIINKYFILQGATIHVYALSQDYYYYLISLEQRREGGSGPFSEPARIYTNIKNGYGIFAGYQNRSYYINF